MHLKPMALATSVMTGYCVLNVLMTNFGPLFFFFVGDVAYLENTSSFSSVVAYSPSKKLAALVYCADT